MLMKTALIKIDLNFQIRYQIVQISLLNGKQMYLISRNLYQMSNYSSIFIRQTKEEDTNFS